MTPVPGKMAATRDALFDTLLDAIAAAPEAKRIALATALENFAEARGDGQYRRICERSAILAEIFATIEEASEARLFVRE